MRWTSCACSTQPGTRLAGRSPLLAWRGMAPGHRRRRPRASVQCWRWPPCSRCAGIAQRLDLDRTCSLSFRAASGCSSRRSGGQRGTAPLRQAAVAGQGRALPRTAVERFVPASTRWPRRCGPARCVLTTNCICSAAGGRRRGPRSQQVAAGSISASARCSCRGHPGGGRPGSLRWIMLGREPRSGTDELLMAYAGILAHGTSLTAAECARMIPQQRSATSIRQAMRWAGDERRLALAAVGGAGFMHANRSPPPGRADLARRTHDEPGDQLPRLAGAASGPGGRRYHRHLQPRQGPLGASSTPSRSCSTSARRVGHRGCRAAGEGYATNWRWTPTVG